ncbi:(d)CMP kinase [Sphingomonas bacterium]|uniref:(d)CMP kinase n=1 Tax=Sphingomonas bacterium TaxID=1895847 RepID=UPI00157514EC|nr:(d)CMP kinase [Sphingomonas bacterium]
MIVAVDGPAASGKGTLARAIARHYGVPHLDTGLLYRAVALCVARMELDPAVEADAVAACGFDEAVLADPALREDATGRTASIVSAHPLVRAALFQRQRRFAGQPGGAVLDGRDIGTVIAPEADAKLFVSATPRIRAQRRHAELKGRGGPTGPGPTGFDPNGFDPISFDRVLADIRARDQRDSARAAAPLAMAADAVLLDTSFLSIEAAVRKALDLVEARLSARR